MCLFSPGCIMLPGPGHGVTVLAACSWLSGGFAGVNAASGDPVFRSRAGAVAPQRSGGHFPVPQPLCTILVCQGQQQPWSRGNQSKPETCWQEAVIVSSQTVALDLIISVFWQKKDLVHRYQRAYYLWPQICSRLIILNSVFHPDLFLIQPRSQELQG